MVFFESDIVVFYSRSRRVGGSMSGPDAMLHLQESEFDKAITRLDDKVGKIQLIVLLTV